LRVLFSAAIKAINQVVEPIRHTLAHDIVVHGTQLLAEARLDVASKLGRLCIDFFAPGRCRFHRILLSHGLAFIHCSTPTSEARAGAGYPLGPEQTSEVADGSPGTELFCGGRVEALQVDWKVGA